MTLPKTNRRRGCGFWRFPSRQRACLFLCFLLSAGAQRGLVPGVLPKGARIIHVSGFCIQSLCVLSQRWTTEQERPWAANSIATDRLTWAKCCVMKETEQRCILDCRATGWFNAHGDGIFCSCYETSVWCHEWLYIYSRGPIIYKPRHLSTT